MNSPDLPPPVSAVVCCYNEQDSLDELLRRLRSALAASYGDRYEIILVDDGSSDATWQLIVQAASADPRVKGLQLSRNFGHQAALSAGLEHSSGDCIFILDADLQDPPELLPRLKAEIDGGADLAYGLRQERLGETAFKRGTAALFYSLLNALSDTPIQKSVGDFRLMTRPLLQTYLGLPEYHRFSRGLFSWLGGKQVAVPYTRDARHAGETHYTLSKMARLAIDALTGFSTAPLRLCGFIGFVCITISLLLFVYIAASFLFFGTARGWTSLAALVTFFGSVQLLSLSIMGEYIGRIFMQSKARPLYVSRETVNLAAPPGGRRLGIDLASVGR